MAIINPDGLFHGERLARCSDQAQLHWVRLFAASNTFGRIELSYRHIVNFAYGSFHTKPTENELSRWIQEYFQNYLLFVYDAADGSTWGQWLTNVEYLSRYHTAADRRSPKPDEKELESYRLEYLQTKSRKSLKINRSYKPLKNTSNHNADFDGLKRDGDISQEEIEQEASCLDNLFRISDVSIPPETILDHAVGIGNGIGIGEGIGEEQKPSRKNPSHKAKAPDPRHSLFRESLEKYWIKKNPKGPAMPWGPAEAKQMALMLAANPTLNLEEFRNLLRNRAKSEAAHGDPVRRWIGNITKFSQPLDRYEKPMNGVGGKNHASVPLGKAESNMAVLEEVIAGRQRKRTFDEDGDLPTSEVGPPESRTIHAVPCESRPEGVSGSDGDTLGEPEGARGDGAPIPW